MDKADRPKQDKQFLTELGVNVRSCRKAAGISQQTLATNIGIERVQVARIERGEVNSGITLIARIALGLDVPISDLAPNELLKKHYSEELVKCLPTNYS